jgi:hypothetical protein
VALRPRSARTVARNGFILGALALRLYRIHVRDWWPCVPGKQIKVHPRKAILRPSNAHRQTLHRYCPDCPQCKECDSHKPADEFGVGSAGVRSKAKRCLGCQYPSCVHCPGYRHPRSKKAVQISHKIGGRCGNWFCKRSKACEQAAMSARKA